MEYILGQAIGSLFSVATFSGILTGTAVAFGDIIGKPLRKPQTISTFVVTSLLCVAMFLYERSFH
jgi:ABC-type Fe3+-siderophore transport system permease subunit